MNVRSDGYKRMKKILLWSYLATVPAWAQEVSWNANTEADLAGYKVYYGYAPGDRQYVVNVGLVTKYQFGFMQDTWLAVTAYDLTGNESGFSNEVVYRAPGNACDCNRDGIVDALDFASLRQLMGQDKYSKGVLNPKYDENYDINKDEKIDALDRVLYKKRCQ